MVSLSSKGMPGRHPWPSTMRRKLAALVSTIFKGESLRGMLLNAYGWWKASQIMYIAALISYGLAALALAGPASP